MKASSSAGGGLGAPFHFGPRAANGFIYYRVCAQVCYQRGWFDKNDGLNKKICILCTQEGYTRKLFLSPQVFRESN